MSKNIAAIEELANHELREEIFSMLEQHERYPDVIRYTWNQCETFGKYLREFSWKTNRAPDFMQRFTKAEADIVNFVAGSVTRKAVFDQYRQRHKSGVEFTKRLLRDLTTFVEESESLRGRYEEMMSKRLKAGLPVDEAMEARFDQKTVA